MTMNSILKRQLADMRQKILEQLKLDGPMTADELSEALGISSMGIRQHLKALEHDELIAHERVQRGMGRPSFVYSLTKIGDEIFPRAYAQMTNSLLDALIDLEGEEGIDRLFAKRTEKLRAEYEKRMEGMSLEEAVDELAKIRTEEGYMADWVALDDGSYVLMEHNCSICKIAEQCSQACTFELKLFQKVLKNARVSREEHMIKGDRMCSYVIQPKGKNGK